MGGGGVRPRISWIAPTWFRNSFSHPSSLPPDARDKDQFSVPGPPVVGLAGHAHLFEIHTKPFWCQSLSSVCARVDQWWHRNLYLQGPRRPGIPVSSQICCSIIHMHSTTSFFFKHTVTRFPFCSWFLILEYFRFVPLHNFESFRTFLWNIPCCRRRLLLTSRLTKPYRQHQAVHEFMYNQSTTHHIY